MVVGAFPAAKLGALLLKQISKPIANAAKAQAKNSPVFRKYICMPPAQFYNWCEVQTKMWILNLGKPVNIPVLNEAMAIELGANLLGEGIIFLIAAGILIGEYYRSSVKETKKEEAKKAEMVQIQRTLQELYFTMEKQGAELREMTRNMHDLETRVVQIPWQSKKSASSSGKDKSPPSEPPGSLAPPILSGEPILTLEELETDTIDVPLTKTGNRMEGAGIILTAIDEIEQEFLGMKI
ncbi:optic atrophy 3 protein opa3 [Holotrichia oblita]|uniref:Optic atrophy 3 protein opa3 n=1 Tax=Holotrichia oblita TaxID=644536 RepID=A0ACB9TR43_HOLOL|nr:optic atrophy 3 protein opa3 [Holotrichia oblita]